MKHKGLILLIFLSFISPGIYPLNIDRATGITENIVIAIRTGNSRALAQYFSTTIEITLPGKEGTFSKVQAEMIIKDFFSKFPPAAFDVNQKGSSSGGSQFIIGTYKSNNKLYKTYLLLKPVDKQLLIQQLQFEEN